MAEGGSETAAVAKRPAGKQARPDGNTVQVSAVSKPLYFYVFLAKKLLRERGGVTLVALGNALAPATSVAEILKKDGVATIQSIVTELEAVVQREVPGLPRRPAYKTKLTVVLDKTPDFEARVAEEAAAYRARIAARRGEHATPAQGAPSPAAAPGPSGAAAGGAEDDGGAEGEGDGGEAGGAAAAGGDGAAAKARRKRKGGKGAKEGGGEKGGGEEGASAAAAGAGAEGGGAEAGAGEGAAA